MRTPPPNTRMQRTRSSASPPRSPLMRNPLGPAKGQLGVLTLVLVLGATVRLHAVTARDGPAVTPSPRSQRSGGGYVPKPGDFTVVCTLFKGDPPGKVSLPDIPITYDPRFVVGARIDEVTLGSSPWKVGAVVRFLIHSPTLMLGGYQFDGRKVAMTFSPFRPKTKDDEVWFRPETRYLVRWMEPR